MSTESLQAVARLRTMGPSGLNPPQMQVVERLEAIDDSRNHPLGDLDIDVWGGSMGITRTDEHEPGETDELVTEFRQWANDQDCTLRPAFDWQSGEEVREGERVATPLITLAVYTDESLQTVYPHVRGGKVRTIHDGVAALESMAERDFSTSRGGRVEIET